MTKLRLQWRTSLPFSFHFFLFNFVESLLVTRVTHFRSKRNDNFRIFFRSSSHWNGTYLECGHLSAEVGVHFSFKCQDCIRGPAVHEIHFFSIPSNLLQPSAIIIEFIEIIVPCSGEHASPVHSSETEAKTNSNDKRRHQLDICIMIISKLWLCEATMRKRIRWRKEDRGEIVAQKPEWAANCCL